VSSPATRPLRAPRTLPLTWYSSFRDASGYADEARTFLLAAEHEGVPFAARDTGFAVGTPDRDEAQREALERALARPAPLDAVLVWHVVPHPAHPLAPGAVNVVRSMFETDRMPRSWLPRLLAVDEVWVPCAFNVETFARSGVPADRLHVLPETIDFDLFDPAAFAAPGQPRPFTFLANFDFTDRKGWDILLDAWADAFAPDDDVRLLLKCLGLNTGGEEAVRARIEQYLAGRDTAEIVLNLELLPAGEMPRLYRAADAFVLPSRGEGWGRPYMEAMAMGLPTIGSAWSGNLEFMLSGNSWLVEGRVVEVAEGAQSHSPLYRGLRWF
jgi:glycosyltransferase involved in cell wall biosynthesis